MLSWNALVRLKILHPKKALVECTSPNLQCKLLWNAHDELVILKKCTRKGDSRNTFYDPFFFRQKNRDFRQNFQFSTECSEFDTISEFATMYDFRYIPI